MTINYTNSETQEQNLIFKNFIKTHAKNTELIVNKFNNHIYNYNNFVNTYKNKDKYLNEFVNDSIENFKIINRLKIKNNVL